MSFLYNILPNYTKSISTKTDTNITGTVNTLEEYLKVYDTEIFGMAASAITELLTFKDVNLIDEKYLPYYAYLLGYEWNNAIDSNIQRNFIINIIDLYKRKGTFFSLNYLLHQIDQTVTMYEPEVDRFIINQSKLSGSSKYEDIEVIKFITTLREYVIITKHGLYTSDLTEFWEKRLDVDGLKEIIVNLEFEEYVTFNSDNIYRSKDGHEWEIVTTIPDIIDVGWISYIQSYIATSASDGIYLSTDCENWFKVSDISGGNNIVSKEGSILISVINNGILYSNDGFDWTVTLQRDVINNLMYTDILGYYVAASNDKVFTSTDGKFWTSYQNLTDISCGIYVQNTNQFFVGKPDGVYMSTDNVNWDKKLDVADVTAIHYSNIENLSGVTPRLYIGTQNYGLFYSVDGEVYAKIADIPNISHIISTVSMIDGRSQILVFTDKDVYGSEYGNEWKVVSQMQFVTGATFSKMFNKFYVSTKLGVFSSDYGTSWEQCYNKTLSDNYETRIEVETYNDLFTLRKGQVFQDSIVRVLDTNLLYQVIDDNKLLSDDFTPTETNNAFEQFFTYFDYYSTAIQGTENLLNDDAFNMVLVGTRSHGMYSTIDGYNFLYKSELNDVCDIQSFLFDSKLKVVSDTIDGYNARFTPLKDSVDGGDASMHIPDDVDGYNAKNNDTKQYIIVCTLEGIYYTDDTDFWQQGANTRYGQSLEAIKVLDEENNINITCKIENEHYVITEYIDEEGTEQTSSFDTRYKAICMLYSQSMDVFVLGSYNGLFISYDGISWEQVTTDKVLYLYEVYDGIGENFTNYIIYNTEENIYASENCIEWMVVHKRIPYNFTIPTINTLNAYTNSNIYYSEDFIRWQEQYPTPKITKAILKLIGDAETLQSSRVFALAGLPALYEDIFRSRDIIFTKINPNDYLGNDGKTIVKEDEYYSPYKEDTLVPSDVYAVNAKPLLEEYKEKDIILTNGEISQTIHLMSSNVYALYLLPNIMSLFQDHDVVITIHDDKDYSNGILAGTLDGVYESYDGKSWTKVLDCGTVYDIIYIGALNRYLVASYTGLYTSSTSQAWVRVIDTKSLTYNSLAFDTFLDDNVNIFVGTNDLGMYYSTDTLNWIKYKDCIANTIRENKYFPSPQYYSPGVIEIQYSNTIDGLDDIVNMVKPAGIYHIYKKFYTIYVNMSIRPMTEMRKNWIRTWFNWEDYPDFDIWADENIDYLNALQYNTGMYSTVIHQGHTFYNGTFVGDMSLDYPYYKLCEVCYASKVNANDNIEKESNSIVYVHRLNVQRSFHGTREEFDKYVLNNNDNSINVIDNVCCYDENCPVYQNRELIKENIDE